MLRMSPSSEHWVIPGHDQHWWTPCLTRGEGGDTHLWFLAPTSDGSLYCPTCRVGRPRVYVGPRERVDAIKAALEVGDLDRAQALAFDNAPLSLPAKPDNSSRPRYRDREDWLEWWKERAAIFEYLGGMPRNESERAATELAGSWAA